MPEVSVVLPVYNGARTIVRAVQSILEQTLRDIELLVVDDGSTDKTAKLVRTIRDPRLRLICSDHRGVAVAANVGTEHAKAPLIARMDADDFAYPQRLQLQRGRLLDDSLDVVGSQVRIVDPSSVVVPSLQRYARWINEETLGDDQIRGLRFVEFPLVNPTIMARRPYFELGFRDDDLPEDYDLMLRAAAAGFRFGKVDQVLLDWTDHGSRLTRTDARYTPAAFARCRRRHLLAGPLRQVQRVDLWGLGQAGKPWLRWLQSKKILIRRGYDINRQKVDSTIHGVPVSHPNDLPETDGTPLIIAVGAENARDLILPQIHSRRYVVGRDAWFVA